jgi:serine/threonine protein kinase
LKLVKIEQAITVKQIEHLFNEKHCLQRLRKNPNFPKLQATFSTRQSVCLALEYIEGVNLYQM